MEVLHPRCAGLDVHKDNVVAAVRLAEPGGVRTEVRRFDTTTPGLLALGDGLAECGCTHAVMEASGVDWKPVWHLLSDGELALVLANAAQVKTVPGRKTDVADAAGLADLLAHGLVRASFGPDPPTQAMRAAAHPPAVGPRAVQPHAAAAQDAGGRHPQAHLGAHRHHGPERSGHP
jgi:transposase